MVKVWEIISNKNKQMIKRCKCNPQKTENEFCDHCGKRKDECVCENMETAACEE